MGKIIDNTNLGHLVSKAKAEFWPKKDVININLATVATSGDYNDLSNKPTIPDVSNFITKSVNDLTNYYLKSETYTKEEVAALIGAIQQFHYEIAASTSAVTSPTNNVLYLIGPTGSGTDKYEEYVYDATKPVAERWIKIGDTTIDLSGYVTTTFLSTELAKYATIASLATVATTGSYDDLEDTPSIPSNVVQYVSQNLTDAQKAQARTNIGAIAPEIFLAEYGVTPASDVLNAIGEHKTIVCVNWGGTTDYAKYFYLGDIYTQHRATFISQMSDDGYYYMINIDSDDGWGNIEEYNLYMLPDNGIPLSNLSSEVKKGLVFIAEYNVTTYSKVNTALNEGKVVFAIKDKELFPFTTERTDSEGLHSRFYFSRI